MPSLMLSFRGLRHHRGRRFRHPPIDQPHFIDTPKTPRASPSGWARVRTGRLPKPRRVDLFDPQGAWQARNRSRHIPHSRARQRPGRQRLHVRMAYQSSSRPLQSLPVWTDSADGAGVRPMRVAAHISKTEPKWKLLSKTLARRKNRAHHRQ